MKQTIAALLVLRFHRGAGNVGAGRPIRSRARRWPSAGARPATCVAKDQKHGNTQAPPFSEIANKPGLTAASIALFLLRPHPPMPDMSLTRNEASDLAAYIKKQGK